MPCVCGPRWRVPESRRGPAGEVGSLWARARRAASTCPSRRSTSSCSRSPSAPRCRTGTGEEPRRTPGAERGEGQPGQARIWARHGAGPGCACVPGARRAGRETSFKSYLNGRAHRGASKQLAFGAHPKYPDNGSPVLYALDLRRFGFSPGGHHGHLRVWGNHLLEGLDDVRSRCDFFFFLPSQNHARVPAPRPPQEPRPRAPLQGEGAAGGGSPRPARPLAPPSITSPALGARLPESSAGVAGGARAAGGAAPPERGCASPPRPSCPAPCRPRLEVAEALNPRCDLCTEQRKAARVSGARPSARGGRGAGPPHGSRAPCRCPQQLLGTAGRRRVGLGARPGREAAGSSPRGWRPKAASAGAEESRQRASDLLRAVGALKVSETPGQSPASGGNAQSVGRPGDNAQIWGKLGAMPSRSGRGRSPAYVLADKLPDRMCVRRTRETSRIQGAPGTSQQTRRGPEPVPAGCGAAEAAETALGPAAMPNCRERSAEPPGLQGRERRS